MNKSEKCCQGCNGLGDKPENLVKFLHNPIAPYFSSAYVTIISIVCGVALAAVFYMAVENKVAPKDDYHPVIIWEFMIAIVSTAVIWHGYIKIIQYKAWPINLYDTLIPITFSVIIVLLSLSVEDIRYFSLCFSFLCLTGYFAYKHALVQLNRKSAIEAYKSHLHMYGNKFYQCVFEDILGYLCYKYNFFKQITLLFLQSLFLNCSLWSVITKDLIPIFYVHSCPLSYGIFLFTT